MDFMTDAGMPPDMMANIADVAQGAFDAHMAQTLTHLQWMHLMLLVAR